MQKMNKKALANVVVLSLLIMLSVVAATILGVFVKNLVNQANLSPQINCIENQAENLIEIENACLNQETNELELTLKRNTQETELISLDFSVLSQGQSTEWCCGKDCANCDIQNLGETKTYYLSMQTLNPESITVSIDSCLLDEKEIQDC
jgi:hypothetical protein